MGVLALVSLGALVVFLRPKSKGMRNVELALPEKARRPPRPVEPAAPPAAPVVAPRAAVPPPRPAESPRAQPPSPAAVPLPPPAVRPAVTPNESGVLAVVRVAEPVIVRFQAEIRKSPFRI